LFSEVKEAAIDYAIMKPVHFPGWVVRKAGSFERLGLRSLSILLSLIFASSVIPIARKSKALPKYSPWKEPDVRI
jgi:hypothetical protein